LLSACTQDDNLIDLLRDALPPALEPQLTATCTSFLGLGPAVAVFKIYRGAAVNLTVQSEHLPNGNLWSRHEAMSDFVEVRSQTSVGVGATLPDGKNCIRNLTADADLILFGENSGTYYTSANEQVVIVLFDSPKDTGAIFVQSP